MPATARRRASRRTAQWLPACRSSRATSGRAPHARSRAAPASEPAMRTRAWRRGSRSGSTEAASKAGRCPGTNRNQEESFAVTSAGQLAREPAARTGMSTPIEEQRKFGLLSTLFLELRGELARDFFAQLGGGFHHRREILEHLVRPAGVEQPARVRRYAL